MAGEKIYRVVLGGLTEIPARVGGRRYGIRTVAGEPAYVEFTDAEEADRAAEEAAPPEPFGGFGRCRASRSGQSVATATATAIQFDTEQVDNAAYHSTSANTDRFTVPPRQAGPHDVRVSVRFDEASAGAGANAGDRVVQVRVGGQAVATVRVRAAAAGDTELALSPPDVELAVGDIVRAGVLQTSGGAMNVDARISLRRLEG